MTPDLMEAGAQRIAKVHGPVLGQTESGRVLPVMMSIIVVLPAPLGPMMQRSSPGAMSRLSLLIALKPSKLTHTSSR